MNKTIVCGTSNLEGQLVPAPLDEKNIITDWIENFLFFGVVTHNGSGVPCDRWLGFVGSELDHAMLYAYLEGSELNVLHYQFVELNYLSPEDIKQIIGEAKLFFEENDYITIELIFNRDNDILGESYKPNFTIKFYHREEE